MAEDIGILENQEFISPLRFNQFLVTSIKYKSKLGFHKTLKTYSGNAIDARDCKGSSLLHIAAEYNNEEAASYLIRLGLDVNLKNECGETPIMISLKKQNFDTAKILLKNKADILTFDTFGMNALRIILTTDLITSYDLDRNVKWLWDYWNVVALVLDKVDEELSLDSEKVTDYLMQMHCPLTHAVFMKNPQVLSTMIKKGSSIDAKERYSGKSALHLAIQYCKLDKIKILLNHGANFKILDYYKKTPIMCIYNNIDFSKMTRLCEVELVKVLLKHRNKLFKSSDHDLVNEIYPIFKYGSKDAILEAINESKKNLFLARTRDGFTLLHVIAENSNPGIEGLLKGRKVYLNLASKYGQTALAHALEHENCNMIEYLLSRGANISGKKSLGYPTRRSFRPLDRQPSLVTSEFKYMKLILEYGLDKEIFTKNIRQTVSIFSLACTDENFASAEPVLAQLAIRKSTEIDIPDVIHQYIQSKIQMKNYYDSCVKELQEAKTSIMIKSFSIFEFLTASDKIISLYAWNRHLVSNLSKTIDQLKLNSYYMKLVQKQCSKILQMIQWREQAERIICESIGVLYEKNAIVTRLIVDYLDNNDIKKLLASINSHDYA